MANPEEIRAAFSIMELQLQAMQRALTQEQAKTAELKDMLDKHGTASNEGGGIISAIRRGQMKDIAPKHTSYGKFPDMESGHEGLNVLAWPGLQATA